MKTTTNHLSILVYCIGVVYGQAQFLSVQECTGKVTEACSPFFGWDFLQNAQWSGCVHASFNSIIKAPRDCTAFDGFPECQQECEEYRGGHGPPDQDGDGPHNDGHPLWLVSNVPPWMAWTPPDVAIYPKCIDLYVQTSRLTAGLGAFMMHLIRALRVLVWFVAIHHWYIVVLAWLPLLDVATSLFVWTALLLTDVTVAYSTWPMHMAGLTLVGCSLLLAGIVGQHTPTLSRIRLWLKISGLVVYTLGFAFYLVIVYATWHQPRSHGSFLDLTLLKLSVPTIVVIFVCTGCCCWIRLRWYWIAICLSLVVAVNAETLTFVNRGDLQQEFTDSSSYKTWTLIAIELLHTLLLVGVIVQTRGTRPTPPPAEGNVRVIAPAVSEQRDVELYALHQTS